MHMRSGASVILVILECLMLQACSPDKGGETTPVKHQAEQAIPKGEAEEYRYLVENPAGRALVQNEAEYRAIVKELRDSFPIKLGDTVESPKSIAKIYDAQGFGLARATGDRSEPPNCFTYMVIGRKQNGMARIYVENSKVTRVDWAWGTRETGPFTKYIRLY